MSNRSAEPADPGANRAVTPTPETSACSLTVTVVVVGGPDHDDVDLTLAGLARQDYPEHLLDVVVTDAAGAEANGLPSPRPARSRLVAAGRGGFAAGVAVADGEVVIRIEAGTIPSADFVTALVRHQHEAPDTVSAAAVRPLAGPVTATEVAAGDLHDRPVEAPDAGADRRGVNGAAVRPQTNPPGPTDQLAFLGLAGLPFAFRRDRYDPGTDPYRGADVEVAYRLAQAGTRFVTEPRALAWRAPATEDPARARRRVAELTTLVPFPRDRRGPGRVWAVPLVCAVVEAQGDPDLVRACVDRLLAGSVGDLRVLLSGDWAEPDANRDLLATQFRGEPRVELVRSSPSTAFPAPYLLRVPPTVGVGRDTVGVLLETVERWGVGLLRVLPPGGGPGGDVVELWRTAAVSRALRGGTPPDGLADAVGATAGQRWETAEAADLTDLASLPTEAVRRPPAGPDTGRRGAGSPQTVPVGGARSLANATVFVARRYARAARRRVTRR